MIQFEHVTKQYGDRTAVDAACFGVTEGETLVLLGTSGSGKTTCLRLVNRLLEPTHGTVRVFGQDIRTQSPEALRRRIGYVIQHVGLFPHFSVRQNIAIVPELLGWPPARINQRVDALLDRIGLAPDRYAPLYPAALSGGEQQRVGLARALAADPPLVLLDEPFGALDPITRAGLQSEFAELQRSLGKTFLLVTHDVTEAVRLGQRICLLDAGRIQQIGPPRQLLFEPASDFVRRFFDASRLELELATLTVADVAGHLDVAPRPEAAARRAVAPCLALRALLEDRSFRTGEPLDLSTVPGSAARAATPAELLAAYYRHRATSARHG